MRAKHAVPVAALCALFAAGCGDGNSPTQPEVQAITVSHFLPSHNDLRAALQDVVAEQNGGLGFEMWATILDRDGKWSTSCSAARTAVTSGPGVA